MPTSSNVVIRVEDLSKRYRIGARQQGHMTLREKVSDLALTPFRGARALLHRNGHEQEPNGGTVNSESRIRDSQSSTIWALKDVSFEIKRGEVVGIIGRNGAGKSTLLKVLSRITEPTSGAVDMYGRVSSLLEVGTGFHHELTGRENIFLNGAILGMRKAEIARKFDEIVAFAEIEDFIDTPVKHYSSGMYVRLAFAVAAHLEPEILLVDEVLAVGDIQFQKKCLAKMHDASQHGRTVLFVSHNMAAITRLCERAILLLDGQVIDDNPAHQVVSKYMRSSLGSPAIRVWTNVAKRPGDDIVRLCRLRICNQSGDTCETIEIRKPVGVEMEYEVLRPGHVLVPNFHFFNEDGIYVFVIHDFGSEWRYRPREVGTYISTAWIPGNFLAEGTFFVGTAVSTYKPVTVHFYERDALAFYVVDTLDGDSARGDFAGHLPGVVRPVVNWTTVAPTNAERCINPKETYGL